MLPRPFRRIQQRAALDCGVATIAMAAGYSYRRARAMLEPYYHPHTGLSDIMEALELFGYVWGGDNPTIMDMSRGGLAPEYFRTFMWGRRAILFIPGPPVYERISRRHAGLQASEHMSIGHFVYYDGHEVHDPARYRGRHVSLDTVRPDYAVLFKDGAA